VARKVEKKRKNVYDLTDMQKAIQK